jgi:sulfite exporter TauE/SafE
MTDLHPGLLLAAWLAGLAGGSGHCLGMCGGIVGMLGIRQRAGAAGYATLLTAHLGRVGGYALAGGFVGLLGSSIAGAALGTVLALSVVSTLLHSLGLGRLPRQASGALLLVFGLWTAAPLFPSFIHGSAGAGAPAEHVHHH